MGILSGCQQGIGLNFPPARRSIKSTVRVFIVHNSWLRLWPDTTHRCSRVHALQLPARLGTSHTSYFIACQVQNTSKPGDNSALHLLAHPGTSGTDATKVGGRDHGSESMETQGCTLWGTPSRAGIGSNRGMLKVSDGVLLVWHERPQPRAYFVGSCSESQLTVTRRSALDVDVFTVTNTPCLRYHIFTVITTKMPTSG